MPPLMIALIAVFVAILLGVKDAEFGMLAEGDQGALTPVYIAPEDRGLVY